jgi:hypothetical protein
MIWIASIGAACHGDPPTVPTDAGAPPDVRDVADAAVDGPAPVPPITVVLVDPASNDDETTVVFQNPDGSTAHELRGPFEIVDGQPRASFALPAGHVSVIEQRHLQREFVVQIRTIVDAKAGDVLTFGSTPPPPPDPAYRFWATDPEDPHLGVWYGTCDILRPINSIDQFGPTSEVDPRSEDRCAIDGQLPLIAYTESSLQEVTRFAGALVPRASDPSAPAFPLGAWSTPVDVTLEGGTTHVAALASGRAVFVDDERVTGPVHLPDAAALPFIDHYVGSKIDSQPNAIRAVYRSVAPSVRTIDLSGDPQLPLLGAQAMDASDPSHPFFTWQSDAPVETADGVLVYFADLITPSPFPDETSYLEWTIVAPPGGSVSAPFPSQSLPGITIHEHDFRGDQFSGVAIVDSSAIDSYDAFRRTYQDVPLLLRSDESTLSKRFPSGDFTLRITSTGSVLVAGQ